MTKTKIARTKRAVPKTQEMPVDAEIKRAAERAGIPAFLGPRDDAAVALAYLKDKLVSVTDLVSESLASVEDQKEREYFDVDGIRNNLRDVHLALWQVRWECYAIGGEVKVAQRAGGAS